MQKNYFNMTTRLMKNLLFTLLLSIISFNALALSTDRDQPAHIAADDIELDFNTGLRTYIGNVKIDQGSLKVRADKLIATYKDGKLHKATAWGNLATFSQLPDGKTENVYGEGKQIIINQSKNTLTLLKKAALKQGGDTARGAKIIYNMTTNRLQIKGTAKTDNNNDNAKPSNPGRSRIIITPKSNQQ